MNYVYTLLISITASLVTFFVTTVIYQAKKERKQTKIRIFSILMSTRNMQDYDAVKALNTIDIAFSDSEKVLNAWHHYRKALRVEGQLTNEKQNEITQSETKMYEAMAEHLGYKNITWDLIAQPHYPIWLSERQQSYRYQDKLIESMARAPVQQTEQHIENK